MPDSGQGASPQHWLVTVMVVDRYWSVQVWVDADNAEDAIAQAQAKFDEATNLGYIAGSFKATEAVQHD